MSTAVMAPPTVDRNYLHLHCVDWETYERLLAIFEQFSGHRLTYDNGDLEIMGPSFQHDRDSRILGKLVLALAEE